LLPLNTNAITKTTTIRRFAHLAIQQHFTDLMIRMLVGITARIQLLATAHAIHNPIHITHILDNQERRALSHLTLAVLLIGLQRALLHQLAVQILYILINQLVLLVTVESADELLLLTKRVESLVQLVVRVGLIKEVDYGRI